jgi:hypothetical protein
MSQKDSVSQVFGGLVGGMLGMIMFVWIRDWIWPIPVGGLVGFALGYYRNEVVSGLSVVLTRARTLRARLQKRTISSTYFVSEAQWEQAKTQVLAVIMLGWMTFIIPVGVAAVILNSFYPDNGGWLLGGSCLTMMMLFLLSFANYAPSDLSEDSYFRRTIVLLRKRGAWFLLGLTIASIVRSMVRGVICFVLIAPIVVCFLVAELCCAIAAMAVLSPKASKHLIGPNGHWLGAVTTIIVTYGSIWWWQMSLPDQTIHWMTFCLAILNGVTCGTLSVATYWIANKLIAYWRFSLPSPAKSWFDAPVCLSDFLIDDILNRTKSIPIRL